VTSRISKRTRKSAIEGLLRENDLEWLNSAARAALRAVWSVAFHETLDVDYLEAAALLRDGWNPGDPVEVRK